MVTFSYLESSITGAYDSNDSYCKINVLVEEASRPKLATDGETLIRRFLQDDGSTACIRSHGLLSISVLSDILQRVLLKIS